MGKCYNSTVVDSSIENVWETIRNFHELSWGDQVVTKVDAVGDVPGTEVGARRVLNDAFHETLLSVDNNSFSFSYSIDDGPGPVSKDAVANYIGQVSLYPVTDTGKTFVEWISTYESDSDQEVSDFCNPIYAGLLSSLKSKI